MSGKIITKSSGNVFIDLGFDPEDAAVMITRVEIACRIADQIKTNGWTLAEVEKNLGVTQDHASWLVKTKVEDLSLDELWRLASRAGVSLQLQPAKNEDLLN